jgi:flagellar biosynthesis protein FlhA
MRIAQQICGDFSDNGVLKVMRLGNRWDLAFHQSLKRDAKGDIVEFDVEPKLVEQFAQDVSAAARKAAVQGEQIVLVAPPEVRTYVRMITERVLPTLPILSHVEIARGVEIKSMGALS